MKVVFLITSLGSGGAERVTVNLANYWAGKGWNITIATYTDNKNDFYLLHPNIERVSLNIYKESNNVFKAIFNNIVRIRRIRNFLKKQKPDVAIAMMTTSNVHLAVAGIGLGLPIIGSERIHPPMFPLGSSWELLRKWLYKYLTAVVALTHRSAVWLQNNTYAKHVVVIPNPIIWPLPYGVPILRPEDFIKKNKKILLSVGRLDKQKGFDLLLNAFAQLASSFPEWDTVIIGEGPERKALESLIKQLNLENRVFLIGRVGNITDWYNQSDIYILSSRFEGFPNTLVEAMAHGLPVIAFDCETGPAEIIRDKIDGLLVPSGDINKLTSTMASLMNDEKLRNNLSSKAIEVRTRFSIEKISSQWENLFENLGCICYRTTN